MEKQEFKQVNEVILSGQVVRKFENDVACNLTIKTLRTNMPNITKAGDYSYNYPEVAFYDMVSKKNASEFKEGDFVEIKGQIQPQRKTDPDTGREYYDQKIIGLKVSPAERILNREFGYDEGDYVESQNMVKLGGVISKISSPSKNVVLINIITFAYGHVNNIQTVLYTRKPEQYISSLKLGDKIFAVGSVQTEKRTIKNGDNRYYKNVVLKAICKAE